MTEVNWDTCKKCKNSYIDVEDGWRCRGYAPVNSIDIERAYLMAAPCEGKGFERSLNPIKHLHPVIQILTLVALTSPMGWLLLTLCPK